MWTVSALLCNTKTQQVKRRNNFQTLNERLMIILKCMFCYIFRYILLNKVLFYLLVQEKQIIKAFFKIAIMKTLSKSRKHL